MIVTVNKTIVSWKLGKELVAAGIPHHGMSLFDTQLEILLDNETQAPQAQTVIDAHTGIDTANLRFEAAEINVRNIPGWSVWSETEALNWFSSNLSDVQIDAMGNLTDAKVLMKKQLIAMKAMARMLVALRDRTWPNLPE